MNRKYLTILLLIFLLAFALRVLFLPSLSLTFGYDQARDALHALEIATGHLKILGPPASTPGLYHGVFYYYVLAPAYLIGHGSPIIAAYWIAFLNALTVFIVFYLTFLMTKKVFPAFLAALLFAVSFEAAQYATWLSNPTIGIWTVPLIYLGLWAWVKEKKRWGAVVAGVGLGLSVQAEIFLLYHFVPVLIWLWMGRKKVKRNELITFGIFFLLSVSTMILSEVKFGFRGLSGFGQLAVASDANLAYAKSVGDYLILYLNQIGRIFAFNSYPGNIGYGGGFVIFLISLALYQWRKKELSWQPFLAAWLFSHLWVVTVGGTSTPFLMVGIGPAVSIIIAIFLSIWWEKRYKVLVLVVLAILVYGNISMILRENKNGSTLFAIQKDMVLSKQLPAIEYTYKESGGKPFSINSLTSPLWINIVWTYLYKWYGQPKYGYVPSWHGRDQAGLQDSLLPTPKDIKNYYLIIEPMGGIPTRYLDETVGAEDVYSRLVNEKYFGEIRVQKREKI